MGTFVSVRGWAEGLDADGADAAISAAFTEIARLETLALAGGPSDLRDLAAQIEASSRGAFRTRNSRGELDLKGLAKGYIIDRAVELLAPHLDTFCVNAGGDMRWHHRAVARSPGAELARATGRAVTLRLGPAAAPVARDFLAPRQALAVSSATVAANDARSTTVYETSALGIGIDDTVVACASTCAVADALTKVAMFANAELLEAVARAYDAVILIFDPNGELKREVHAQI